QHDLRVTQLKNPLQVWDQDVIQTGEKAPHEEENGDDGQRTCVTLDRRGTHSVLRRLGADCCSFRCFGYHISPQPIRLLSRRATRSSSWMCYHHVSACTP